MMSSQPTEILKGQRWIKRHGISNWPLNIEVIEGFNGKEFNVRDVLKGDVLSMPRSFIVENYDRKLYDEEMDFNEQICEIKGWRYTEDKNGNWIFCNSKGKQAPIPSYVWKQELYEKLLESLKIYEPKIKIAMGSYAVFLNKIGSNNYIGATKYVGSSKGEAVCKAWIDKNS